MPEGGRDGEDPEWSQQSSEDSVSERKEKKARKNERRVRKKRRKAPEAQQDMALDEASVKAYFDYLDTEQSGTLTKRDIVRTAEALHVEMEDGQVNHMLKVVKQISDHNSVFDRSVFQKLIEHLNSTVQ